MSIPRFDPTTGLLPPGEHDAGWDEVESRSSRGSAGPFVAGSFSTASPRDWPCSLMAGCTRLWINGSFVTAKDEPGDFDCVWSTLGVDRSVLEDSAPELLDLSDHRAAQKARFGGEFLPNITETASGRQFAEFFQSDRDGIAKGIVVLDPTKETWP